MEKKINSFNWEKIDFTKLSNEVFIEIANAHEETSHRKQFLSSAQADKAEELGITFGRKSPEWCHWKKQCLLCLIERNMECQKRY